jgi:hypothetical protein
MDEGASPFPPPKRPTLFERVVGSDSLHQRLENKKMGIGRQKFPFVTWTFSLIMLGVLVYELVYNAHEQGNPFSLKVLILITYPLVKLRTNDGIFKALRESNARSFFIWISPSWYECYYGYFIIEFIHWSPQALVSQPACE